MMLLSQVIPAGLDAFIVCDRADQLADGVKWLFGALPTMSSLAIKTALIGAARAAGVGGLDLLDPLEWKLRGLALDKGLAIWALPREGGAILLVGVHREREAFETCRALCSSQRTTFQDLGDLTLVLEDGAAAGAFGFTGGYLWVATRAGSSEEAKAKLHMIQATLGGQVDEVARRVLGEAPSPPQALRIFATLEQTPVAMAIIVMRNELEISLRLDEIGDNRELLSLVATRSPERNLARLLPRGVLAVLSGIDLSPLLGDARPREPVVGLVVLHEIEPRIVSMLRRKVSPEEILRSGVVRASFLARVRDDVLWRKATSVAVEKNGGGTHQRRDPLEGERTVYAILLGSNESSEAHLWVTFEHGLMLAALSESDLNEIRTAARIGVGGLESSIADVEARRLLTDGEPLLHVKVADLTERFSGLVGKLWMERELASGFGVRELINFLAKMPDATAQMMLDAPEDGHGMDLWLKIRVR